MLTPETIAPIGGGILAIALGGALIFTNTNAEMTLVRSASDALRLSQTQSKLEEAQLQESERRAISRYQAGCARYNGELQEGMIFSSIPPNTPVCNQRGVTLQVGADFVGREIARTSDLDVVYQRFSTNE